MPNKVGYEQVCQTNSRGVNSNEHLVNMISPESKLDPRCSNQVNNTVKNNTVKNNTVKK